MKMTKESLYAVLRRMNSVLSAPGLAKEWLSEDPLFLDTETTGLDNKAQIIEIAVTDSRKTVLLNSKVKPTIPVDPEAQRVHGISADELEGCPQWPELANQVQELLTDRHVIIFNAAFDTRLLQQTAAAFGLTMDINCNYLCAMGLAARAFGATNRYGSISLASATEKAGVIWEGNAHSALADTLATVDLVRIIAER